MGFLIALIVIMVIIVVIAVAKERSARKRRIAAQNGGGMTPASTDHNQPSRDTITTREPYRYVDDAGVLVYGNSVWGHYRIGGLTDDLISDDEVEEEVGRQSADMHAFAQNGSRNIQCYITVTRRPFDPHDWAEQLLTASADPTANYRTYIRKLGERVSRVGAATPVAYLAVRLGTLTEGSHLEAMPLPTGATARKRTNSLLGDLVNGHLIGVHEETLTPEQAAAWQTVAASVPTALPHWRLTPASRRDMVYLIRENWYGDLPVPVEPNLGARPWGPGDFELVLARDADNSHRSYVQLTPPDVDHADIDGDARSLTATLVVTEWPRELRFSHAAAWMRRAIRTDQRVRIHYRYDLLPPDEFGKIITKAARDLNDEVADFTKAARVRTGQPDGTPEQLAPTRMVEQAVTASELAIMVKDNHIPGVSALPRFSVSAETPDALREVVAALTREMHRMDISLEWPKKLQWRLFEERLPGDAPDNPALARRQWGRLTEIETIPGGLPHSTSEVGDMIENDRGIHRGWIGPPVAWSKVTRQPVFYSNHSAMARNRGSGVAIIGASGNGKSNLLMKLLYEDSESGVRCIAVDPKGDIAIFCYYLAFGSQIRDPENGGLSAEFKLDADAGRLGTKESRFQPTDPTFWASTSITDVMTAANGSLDVFVTTDDIEVARTRALAVLQTLLNPNDWEIVRPAIEEALDDLLLAPFYAASQKSNEAVAARLAGQNVDSSTVEIEQRRAARALPEWPTLWRLPQLIREQHKKNENRGVTGDDAARWRRAASLLTTLAGDGGANKGLPVARLLFARDANAGLAANTWKRRTIYTISRLKTPLAGTQPEKWRPDERAAAAVMYMVTAICSDVMDEAGTSPKAMYIDELHVLTGLEDGRLLVVDTLRKGRSRNGSMVVASQQAQDLAMLNSADIDSEGRSQGKASTNQIPTVFAFGQGGGPECAQMADVLRPNGSSEPTLVNALLELGTGECVMRDATRDGGRISKIDVDLGFTELFRAADTNPQSSKISHSHPVPADIDDWTERPMPGDRSEKKAGAA